MDVEIQETEVKVQQEDKKVVAVQIPSHIYNEIKDYADKRYLKVSDILRVIIYNWYEDKEQELFKLKGNDK